MRMLFPRPYTAAIVLGSTVFAVLAGCAPKNYTLPTPQVIVKTDHYVISRVTEEEDGSGYIIYADSAKYAQDAANIELSCQKAKCLITPAGLIFIVTRLETRIKPKK